MVPSGFADLYHELYWWLRDRSTETEMRDTVRRLAAFYRVDTAVNSIGSTLNSKFTAINTSLK